jgi:alpha-N-arabinofuranosidase
MRMFGTFVRQDKGPKIVAVGASGDDYAWTEEMMKSHDKMDVLGLHYYTLPTGDWSHKGAAVGFPKAEWFSTFAQTRRMEELITRHSAIMDKADPDKKVGLAVDEWGTWYDTPPGAPALWQENTLRDALVAATNFHIFQRHADRVRMANIAQMVNVLQSVIMTDGERMIRTPTYYAFLMYRPFQGATALPVSTTGPNENAGSAEIPAIDVTAARGADGAVHVGIVNVDLDQPADVEVNLGKSGRAISGEVLTASAMDARNRFGAAEEVRPVPFRNARWAGGKLHVRMPAKSIVVLTVK